LKVLHSALKRHKGKLSKVFAFLKSDRKPAFGGCAEFIFLLQVRWSLTLKRVDQF